MAEVEAYIDVSIMFAIIIGLSALALLLLLPELVPK